MRSAACMNYKGRDLKRGCCLLYQISGAINIILPGIDPEGGPEERCELGYEPRWRSTMAVGAETSWPGSPELLAPAGRRDRQGERWDRAAALAKCLEENTAYT
jgi:hypothetical protein